MNTSRHSDNINHSFASVVTETSGPETVNNNSNIKYIGTVEDMTNSASSVIKSDRSTERLLLIPDLVSEKSDSETESLASSPDSPKPQAPEQAHFRPGYMNYSHIRYEHGGDDDDDGAEEELHPFLQAGVGIVRGCVMILMAVVTIVLTTVHTFTEICWYLPLMYKDPLARERDVIKSWVGGCKSAVKVRAILTKSC